MNVPWIKSVLNNLIQITNSSNSFYTLFDGVTVAKIRENIFSIANEIEQEDRQLSAQLREAKDKLFWTDSIGRTFLHPVIAGSVIFGLEYLINKQENKTNDSWALLHPSIIRASKKLYLDGHCANAVVDAFIEINERLKNIFKQLCPGVPVPDGANLMNTIFSVKTPILKLCDLTSQTGEDKQKGLMMMAAGAMAALRNPKSHAKSETVNQDEAMRRLMFASMLMYQIDEAVAYSNITE